MGTTDSAFYLYPLQSGAFTRIDFGSMISDIVEYPYGEATSNVDMLGRDYTHFLRGGFRLRITLELFPYDGLQRSFQTLVNHLIRGGSVGFSRVRSKAWAAWRTVGLSQSGTSIQTTGNLFSAWESSATLADLDEVVIETGNPQYYRDYNRTSGLSGGVTVPLYGGVGYEYLSTLTMVRYRDFYPALYLPNDQRQRLSSTPIVTYNRRFTSTIDITLEVDQGLLLVDQSFQSRASAVGNSAPTLPVRGSSSTNSGRQQVTLEQLTGRDTTISDPYVNQYVNNMTRWR